MGMTCWRRPVFVALSAALLSVVGACEDNRTAYRHRVDYLAPPVDGGRSRLTRVPPPTTPSDADEDPAGPGSAGTQTGIRP